MSPLFLFKSFGLTTKIIEHNHIIFYTYLKQHDAPEDIEYYLCGPPMMAKTVLDLLHSLGVEDDMIMFDDLWQLPQIKPPSVVGVQGLRYWIA